MEVIVVLMIGAAGFLSWRLSLARRQIAVLRCQLLAALPFVKAQAGPDVELDFLFNAGDWEYADSVRNGGGHIDGFRDCPCQREYTTSTQRTIFPQRPTPQQLQNCFNNPPPIVAAEWQCPDDCVQVLTHTWTGYSLLKNQRTGQYMLNCNRYAQYHCKKPNDPARDAPPVEEPPPDVEV